MSIIESLNNGLKYLTKKEFVLNSNGHEFQFNPDRYGFYRSDMLWYGTKVQCCNCGALEKFRINGIRLNQYCSHEEFIHSFNIAIQDFKKSLEGKMSCAAHRPLRHANMLSKIYGSGWVYKHEENRSQFSYKNYMETIKYYGG